MMSTAQGSRAIGLYWIGVIMVLACLGLILTGNTDLVWPFEHTGIPLSWMLGGGAVLAFLAFELCDDSSSVPQEAEDRVAQLTPEWEAVEY
jgi:hypothetical protein